MKYSRETGRFYYSINMMRGILAFLIMFHHLGGTMSMPKYFNLPFWGQIFSVGNARVAFFFVLSGFVIYLTHHTDFDKPRAAKYFLLKRFVRIYPAFWFVFVVVGVLAYCTGGSSSTVPTIMMDYVRGFFLLPSDKNLSGGTGAPILIVAWTLHYEILFYIFISIAMFRRNLALFIIFIYLIFSAIPGITSHYPLSFVFDQRIWLFLCGMAAANHWLNGVDIRNSKLLLLCSVFSLGILSCIASFHQNDEASPLFLGSVGVFSSLILLSLIDLEVKGKIAWCKSSVFQEMGNISYSLFLIHFPLISIFAKISVYFSVQGFYHSFVFFFVVAFLCIFFAVAFNKMVERPLVNFLNGYFRRT